jgi:hypothetical protein
MAPKTGCHKEQQLYSSSYFDKFIETVGDCLVESSGLSMLNLNSFFKTDRFSEGTNYQNSIEILMVEFARLMSDYTRILTTGQKLGALLRKADLPWIKITTSGNQRIVNILPSNNFNK